MNPKLTREMIAALNQQVGPIRLETDGEPVFLVRLEDVIHIQKVVDDSIRSKLAEADADIAAGCVGQWDVEDIKKKGRQKFKQRNN